MEVQGRLIKLFDATENKGFKKREFILETEYSTQYPQEIKFQLSGEKVSLLDSIPMNTDLIIYFNLRGRRWESPDKGTIWFNSLEAWKYKVPEAKEPPVANETKEEIINGEEEMPF